MWVGVHYIYWIVNLNVVYMPGNAFINALFFGIAECASMSLSGMIVQKVPTILAFKGSLILTFIFGILFIMVPYQFLIPLLIFVTVLGIGSAYNSIFLIQE
jgi:hypothetical protein